MEISHPKKVFGNKIDTCPVVQIIVCQTTTVVEDDVLITDDPIFGIPRDPMTGPNRPDPRVLRFLLGGSSNENLSLVQPSRFNKMLVKSLYLPSGNQTWLAEQSPINGGFWLGKSLISMVHFPESHV